MAAIRSSRLRVGGCTSEAVAPNDTIPIARSSGQSSTKLLAAIWAAVSRFGSTSLAPMLSETSMARTTVFRSAGSVMTAVGPAQATIRTISESRNSSGGRWRRNHCPGPIASRMAPMLAYLMTCFFLRRSSSTYAATSTGARSRSQRNSGWRNFICSRHSVGHEAWTRSDPISLTGRYGPRAANANYAQIMRRTKPSHRSPFRPASFRIAGRGDRGPSRGARRQTSGCSA